MTLIEHAKQELELNGMFDKDMVEHWQNQ